MSTRASTASDRARLGVIRDAGGTLHLEFAGAWTTASVRPGLGDLERALEGGAPPRVVLDASAVSAWDSSLLTALVRIEALCAAHGATPARDGLPTGVRRLLALAEAVPEKQGARRTATRPSFLSRVGTAALAGIDGALDFLRFVGEATLAFGRLVTFRARFRRQDLALVIQECGAEALPITTLIAFLVGLILAFVGSVQLKLFGAEIYVANLVAIGMAREMGAMMTAIILAGRTGAAFAAQLGTMKVTEEIDALTTMGIPPIEFLVLPRMLALSLMMPLLTVYANAVGMVGGAVVGIGMLGLKPALYLNQTLTFITLTDFATGIAKSVVFGVLVALSGCLRGMQCGSSASAVGEAATSAVVTCIVLIVVTDGVFAVLFSVLGI